MSLIKTKVRIKKWLAVKNVKKLRAAPFVERGCAGRVGGPGSDLLPCCPRLSKDDHFRGQVTLGPWRLDEPWPSDGRDAAGSTLEPIRSEGRQGRQIGDGSALAEIDLPIGDTSLQGALYHNIIKFMGIFPNNCLYNLNIQFSNSF